MMKSTSHSHKCEPYESKLEIVSEVCPGVTFTIRRMSFGRRLELTRQVRELGQKGEFLEAGQDFPDKIEAAILRSEIDGLYLRWSLENIRGLLLDGAEADPEALIAVGPENLFREVVNAIKAECGLSDAERKNS